MKDLKDAGLVTQLVVVATMMPKVKQYIDDLIAENETLKADTIPYKELHKVVKNVLTEPSTLANKELIVFLMDEIDKASQWLIEGQTHMATGVLGQCHAEIRKHLSK